MTLTLSTFGLAVLSALVPLVNIEAYLVLVAATFSAPDVLLAVVAAVGQMAGKLVWYQAGASSTRIPWVARQLRKPSWQASFTKWQQRTSGRPWFTGALLFVSAAVGFPPYAVIAALAGALRVQMLVFLTTGLVGRFLRFWLVIVTAGAVLDHWG